MILEQVEVRCVRNIGEATLALSPRLNLLLGPNGAGKTALLEALNFLVRGRAVRSRGVSSLIQHGAPALSVHASGRDDERGQVRIGVERDRANQTRLRLDGEAARQSSVAALLPIQLLLPNLADLVFGGPRERRQWLDWGAFHVKPSYVEALRGYVRSVRQRNAVLRSEDRSTLDAWTERMVRLGDQVSQARWSYLDEVRPAVLTCLKELAPELELALEYHPGHDGEQLAEAVGASMARDVKSGSTQVGPHRADVRLGSGGADAAAVLSRGQGKAVASALRIGQAQGLLSQLAARSLFLIDDVWAELDSRHSERFFGLLSELDCQILATSTQDPNVAAAFGDGGMKVFHVKQGTVRNP